MKNKKIGGEISQIKNLFSRVVENSDVIKCANKLTSSNSYILGFLYRHKHQDVFQKTIEETFMITKSTASQILKLMEQNGLISRIPVESDARLKKIILTENGEAIHSKIRNRLDEVEEIALNGFSENDKKKLFEYLDKVKTNLKNNGGCKC